MKENGKYVLPALPYDYDALEPFIDEETLHFHHDKHHQAYTDKFNAALEKHPEMYKIELDELFKDLSQIPEDIRKIVTNNGGGYLNHIYYFESLSPNGGEPSGDLLEQINETFGSLEEMKNKLAEASVNQFGSGYGWLVKDASLKLKIYGLPNQDSPLSLGDTPLLPIDVWEHAYYLKYKNERPKYLENIWNIINWDIVKERFSK